MKMSSAIASLGVLLAGALPGLAYDAAPRTSALAGTWTLAYADVEHPDGSRTRDYGASPRGRLQIDRAGRYALLIFDASRPRFAQDEKSKGTPDEMRAAMLGTSAHFGTIDVDAAKRTLTFYIEGSTFPNWEGTTQVRVYELDGDTLVYRVAPRANGDVPISGWSRISRE
ncbi:MAG TPA: lipocalin-like domain-containing protein [Rudaea sp.]|nr:lipocalin-like domain-containing protein [Rudaea sp.]